MKTQDPGQDLLDSIEVTGKPPAMEPMRTPRPPRPRLCEAGPCRNYHRLELEMDAEAPMTIRTPVRLPPGTPGAQAVPGATAYSPPAAFHTQVHHYCYPSPGIEMPLGDLAVTACNRWEPVERFGTKESLEAERFLRSTAGQQYLQAVAEWDKAYAAERAESTEVDRLIMQHTPHPPRGLVGNCETCDLSVDDDIHKENT